VFTVYCSLFTDHLPLLTPDQRAHRLFQRGQYAEAAERFTDPMWKGVALFENGDFKEAAGVFAGFDTAEGAFNHGNALVMLGKYEDAAARYQRALELKPAWKPPVVNLEIARGRAKLVEKKGGDMTGGAMGADEITFEKGPPPSSAGDEQIEATGAAGDAELRAVWLRQVQTKPADFLKAKFAYQAATRTEE
jgi:Ca-activated chloride channel family protein